MSSVKCLHGIPKYFVFNSLSTESSSITVENFDGKQQSTTISLPLTFFLFGHRNATSIVRICVCVGVMASCKPPPPKSHPHHILHVLHFSEAPTLPKLQTFQSTHYISSVMIHSRVFKCQHSLCLCLVVVCQSGLSDFIQNNLASGKNLFIFIHRSKIRNPVCSRKFSASDI